MNKADEKSEKSIATLVDQLEELRRIVVKLRLEDVKVEYIQALVRMYFKEGKL